MALPNLRRRRGVAKRSLTNLFTKISELEAEPRAPTTTDRAKQLVERLEDIDKNFRSVHLDVIDAMEEDSEDLEREHEVLDKHENDVSEASLRLQTLMKPTSTTGCRDDVRPLSRKLSRAERCLRDTDKVLTSIASDASSVPLLEQHQERVGDVKHELSALYEKLALLDLPDDHELVVRHGNMENLQFRCSHRIRTMLSAHKAHPPKEMSISSESSSKLPKLEIPTFDGDVLHWRQFWDQFEVSVHRRDRLTNAEKLVYLQQAVKGGSARTAIEGLSRSGDQYDEAIDCLKARYNRPRLIHRAHVRTIMDAPSLKDGTGKELRHLHDVLQQHLRALKSMGSEPDSSFLTSVIELKLDSTTLFEWQKHSRESVDSVPHYRDILEFLDLRAQASESSIPPPKKHGAPPLNHRKSGKVTSLFATNPDSGRSQCILCTSTSERHPLYACPKFKSLSHEGKLSTLRKNNLCLNCLGSGHFVKQCKSSHRCRKCQRPHHTLLHTESHENGSTSSHTIPASSPASDAPPTSVVSNAAIKLRSSTLLMTCRVIVFAPNGSSMEARALLDSASTSSFVSEQLVQTLQLPRSRHSVRVCGIAGSLTSSPDRAISGFQLSSIYPDARKLDVTAIVLPKVTCDLPAFPVPLDPSWTHLLELPLADPAFGQPGRIDLLLGVQVFVDVLRHGRRVGPSGSPTALETELGWVLADSGTNKTTVPSETNFHAVSFHASALCTDDILRKFWEVEESPVTTPVMSPEERAVVKHFETNYSRTKAGRFVVPLPRKPGVKPIGESRYQAVRRFMSLERSLHYKNKFAEVDAVIQEYMDLEHAEVVPPEDMGKQPSSVFYLPMHVVYKGSSTTTKVRAVFDASAKSATGISLNDTLMVGPTVHPPLIDVLLKFRVHRIGLTTDVSKMYRGVELIYSDRDFHRFVWRSDVNEPLKDFRMVRLTFGVSASCFAANMAVKQNARDFVNEFPHAAEVVHGSFYVDDGLTGANDVASAINLQQELQDLFTLGGFLLRKWNSSEPRVLEAIYPDLREQKEIHPISASDAGHTKTLGLEWNTVTDSFHLMVIKQPLPQTMTKRALVSDIAKVFDVLGWFSPATITMKILLQRVWEQRIGWDDVVPEEIRETWYQWRLGLDVIAAKSIPRCYFPKDYSIMSLQVHGFSDASVDAYAGVVYLRVVDVSGAVHTSIVVSKTKVSPIKKLSIPRLELCGAHVLAKLLDHVRNVLQVPLSDVFAWTDSTIVLNWLAGSSRRFKTYVGNRVSSIMDLIPPDRWGHVDGIQNPADCASRGLLPSALVSHNLWWSGPYWLRHKPSDWPKQPKLAPNTVEEEGEEICNVIVLSPTKPVVSVADFSSLLRLKRVTAWIYRFATNSQSPKGSCDRRAGPLSAAELDRAEKYWIQVVQEEHFGREIATLRSNENIPSSSSLAPLTPFFDGDGLLRVGGREANSSRPYNVQHPLIIHAKHPVVSLIVHFEHLRLLHAGPLLLGTSLARRYHIVRGRSLIRSIARGCVICRRGARPRSQMMGQLPAERVTAGSVFDKVGVDYAGPVYTKIGPVRRPTLVKSYVAVFVSLSVKAVHLEAVSDLTADAFLACLRRFVARRGKPVLIWSDHGTNFVGAARMLTELHSFLREQETNKTIASFCASQGITWDFVPERAPHFGGLWEAAVKSMKRHLHRIVGNVKLTFEELSTILCQIEACLNSRPLTPLTVEPEVEVLTPGHFLITRPLEAIPDPSCVSEQTISTLKRWNLCQSLVRHFWRRWSSEYLTTLQRLNKWHRPSRNFEVDDVVLMRDETLIPTHWPIARVVKTHPGKDGLVRVVEVKTAAGTYTRPANKVVLLLPCDS